MPEQDPIASNLNDHEPAGESSRRAKQIIGAMAIGGGTVTLASTAELVFDFTDQITTFVAGGVAVSSALFTLSKIGYLYRLYQAEPE